MTDISTGDQYRHVMLSVAVAVTEYRHVTNISGNGIFIYSPRHRRQATFDLNIVDTITAVYALVIILGKLSDVSGEGKYRQVTAVSDGRKI